jgi:hypothetical protein
MQAFKSASIIHSHSGEADANYVSRLIVLGDCGREYRGLLTIKYYYKSYLSQYLTMLLENTNCQLGSYTYSGRRPVGLRSTSLTAAVLPAAIWFRDPAARHSRLIAWMAGSSQVKPGHDGLRLMNTR